MTNLNLFGHELVVDNFAGGGGASTGSESDTLPPNTTLGEHQPERQHNSTMRVSSEHRAMIARITDLAIDVSLAGKYHANVSLVTSCWDFSVYVCRVGQDATNAIYGKYAYLHWENDADASPDNALPEMIANLEALLIESVQEGQPS